MGLPMQATGPPRSDEGVGIGMLRGAGDIPSLGNRKVGSIYHFFVPCF